MATKAGLTARQVESIQGSTALVNIWDGAVSSGKTVASIYRWLMFIAATTDLPGEHVLTGRTRDTAWRNIILPAMQLYPGCITGNMGAPFVTILGERVHIIGASDAKAELVIRGMTCKSVYIDEVTTVPEGYFKMAISRLRVTGRKGGIASKLFGATNPDNPNHWLKRDYFDRMDGDPEIGRTWRRFHFKLGDNTHLSPHYIETMKSQYTGLFAKRFIDGLWVQGDGTIWDCWDEDRHVVDIIDIPVMDRVVALGVDFGSNHKSAGLLLGVAKGRLWVLAEWAPQMLENGTLSPSVQSESLRRWLRELPSQWGSPEFVFVDSAALAFRDQLMVDGLDTQPAWKKVKSGLQLVHSLFSNDKLMVNSVCTELRREIPGYVWDPKAADRGEDAPIKTNDDFCDALRYAIYSSRPQWQGLVDLKFEDRLND